MTESRTRVRGSEVPVHLPLLLVRGVLPCTELVVQYIEIINAAAETLTGECGELDLCDVQPGPVLGRVVDLEALSERMRSDGVERLVQ